VDGSDPDVICVCVQLRTRLPESRLDPDMLNPTKSTLGIPDASSKNATFKINTDTVVSRRNTAIPARPEIALPLCAGAEVDE